MIKSKAEAEAEAEAIMASSQKSCVVNEASSMALYRGIWRIHSLKPESPRCVSGPRYLSFRHHAPHFGKGRCYFGRRFRIGHSTSTSRVAIIHYWLPDEFRDFD